MQCGCLRERCSVSAAEPRVERVANAPLGEVVKPMGKFHGVRVRVVDNAVGDIGHGGAVGGVGAILTPTPAGLRAPDRVYVVGLERVDGVFGFAASPLE